MFIISQVLLLTFYVLNFFFSYFLMFMSHTRSRARVYLEYAGNYACTAFPRRADQRLRLYTLRPLP